MHPREPKRDEDQSELRAQLTATLANVAALEERARGLREQLGDSAPSSAQPQEIEVATLRAILERTRAVLRPEEYAQLKGAVDAFAYVTRQLETTTVTLARLRRFLFGTSEKTSRVLGETGEGKPEAATPQSETSSPPEGPEATTTATAEETTPTREGSSQSAPDRKKVRGHGRHSAAAYTGATKIPVPHPVHHHGDRCPDCKKGRIYGLREPRALVRIIGVAPLSATVYECEQLRCNLCQEIYAAPPPAGVGAKKYDESATSMIALAKYGVGLPFNRIEQMQHALGVPMPATTQWELVLQGAKDLLPVQAELVRQGAAGEVLHNDDTSMKVLELSAEQREQLLGENAEERTGVFTSGIVAARASGERIALYYTGPRHSGENIASLLAKRSEELPPPIQMCDASATNTTGEFETIVANCLAHGRRHFVDVAPHFPQECRFVLETLREVYRNDAHAREQKLTANERLQLHQELSAPLMTKLREWLDKQFVERLVEPNSSLGEAVGYLRKHWDKLTLFLRKPSAPLDNNICERALKKAILHRKNSLFYKTLRGSAVGDLFMSLIHTCELNGVGTFEYLLAVLRHHEAAAKNPAAWMPWTYRDTLQRQ